MARRGDVVENPLTGERVTFLEPSETRVAICCGSSTRSLPVGLSPRTSTRARRSATRYSRAR